MHVTIDGVEAMAFLRHEGAHTRAPRPDIILLDLNLPKMDGREVLAHIKSDEDLKTIPTVSPGDVRLTQEAFRDANRSIRLHVASDGVEAMAFLQSEGVHADEPRPDIILLDLNLPKMDGREVLAHIKEDSGLKMIPTVILTTSEAETDIVKSYQLQANCYLSKPVQLDDVRKSGEKSSMISG